MIEGQIYGGIMSKNFWIILVVVVAALIGIFALSGGKAKTPQGNKYSNGNILEVKESDHKLGAGTKKVTIIEYGDYQCPSCGRFFPIIEQARAEYKDDIQFVFRNFPLISIHPNAQAAARAAEAAAKQGKFEQMYSQLYQTQEQWSGSKEAQAIFESFASQLGLNMDQFKSDYSSEAINTAINDDLESGKKTGVTGTPTIFVNGKQNDSPASYEEFKQLIDKAIADANPVSTPAPVSEPTPAPAQ